MIRWTTAFLDTPGDQAAAAERFWCAITGSTLSTRRGPTGEFATLQPPDGDPYLRVQVLHDGPPGVHLDLHVNEVEASATQAHRLGARTAAEFDDYTVLRSPGGFTFCLVPADGSSVRPRPTGDPSSLVDQISLDIPTNLYETEAAFWAALTGWAYRDGALPEFGYLERPADLPLRILLQRCAHNGVTAHLDLACEDVETELTRHQALGATHHGSGPHWHVLRDPADRSYCLTSRNPRTGRL